MIAVAGQIVVRAGQPQGGRIHAIHFALQHGFREAALSRFSDSGHPTVVGGGLRQAASQICYAKAQADAGAYQSGAQQHAPIGAGLRS